MEIKGWVTNTVEDYETKQAELAVKKKIGLDSDGNPIEGQTQRYAGMISNGATRPDVKLKNGKFFIPDEDGPDTINKSDIEVPEIQ